MILKLFVYLYGIYMETSVGTTNIKLQFLNIYIYIYIYISLFNYQNKTLYLKLIIYLNRNINIYNIVILYFDTIR